jgi:hypothetical protein
LPGFASQKLPFPSKNSKKLRIVEATISMKFRPLAQTASPLALLALLALPTPAFAQWAIIMNGIEGCDFDSGWMTAACIPNFIAHLVAFVYGLIGLFFVVNVMLGGYQLAIAYIGESDKGAGKDRIKWSIIGLIVSSCIFLILDLVLNVVLGS